MAESRPVSSPIDPNVKLTKPEGAPDCEELKLPYTGLVGALMYLAVATRPDIAFVVSYLSQFNECFKTTH
ncbi:hypothetical protein KPH14_012276 [Odynerus spinipes]|uniref:Retrovirus-related Pol polyprotein from transposon TNT 1-94 n=1 Tax=Odynerus spinipes TaxID=1348599 RepID=A0AAD9VM17_9HYME|nr:hypothetical protein KPH14_012276 [Odynerus spinipes]